MKPDEKSIFLAALREKGACSLIADGTSMWPFIKSGDRIVFHAVIGDLHAGQVVGFFINNQLIIHRITRKYSNDLFETRGDAMPGSACRIHANDIAGAATSIMRNNKRHAFWLSPFGGKAAIFSGPFLRMALSIKQLLAKIFKPAG